MKPEILFLGLHLRQARILASRMNYIIRIIENGSVGTNDLEPDRLNLVVENDVVVESYFG